MLSNKPYLIRAFYDWIVDSACTPFLVVNANFPHCHVPKEYIENGEITLNISPTAVRDLKISNNLVECRASFSGMVYVISVPIKALLAIYARENQEGMFFDMEEPDESDYAGTSGSGTTASKNKEKSRAHLKLVE